MEIITLYSTGCAYCTVVSKLLADKRIPFNVVSDEDAIRTVGAEHGISSLPILEVGGKFMNVKEAVQWVNAQEARA